MKRKIIIGSTINYVVAIAVFSYALLNGASEIYTKVTLGSCILFLLGVWFYNLKKADLYADGNQLIVDDNTITLKGYKKADQSIKFEDIKEVWQERRWLKLVNKYDGQKPLLISNVFEPSDEIRKQIEAKGFTIKTY